MFIPERHEPLLPFPRLPEAFKARYSAGDLALRPFGLYESDLDVDFDRTPRPVLVTRILECCTRDSRREKVEQGLFWSLTVGKRIECLLNLLCSGAGSEISVALRCPDQACREESEIEISIGEIASLQEQAYANERIVIRLENETLALRRPTGSDQLAWLKNDFANEEAAVKAMVRTLLLDDTEDASVHGDSLGGERLQSIEQAMEEHDPLVNFSVWIHCPSCGVEHLSEIDLEDLSLGGLRQAQLRLLASVHRLAAHYHWSEHQIFSVPYWRRAHYLRLIENGSDR